MKILNWVHRRLNGPTSSVSLHTNKGHEVSVNNQEVEMKDSAMVKLSTVQDREEALLGFENGLLTIGTLGFHVHHSPNPDFTLNPRLSFRNSSNSVFETLDSLSDDQDTFDTTSYIEETIEEENDEKPLIYNTYNHQEIEEIGDEIFASLELFQPVELLDLHDISSDISVKSDRTTLADLFKADQNDSVIIRKSPAKSRSVFEYGKQIMDKQKKFPTSFSFKVVQKLIHGHEIMPIKKINHMMRRMMKRKIYPAELPHQKSASKMENHGMMTLSFNNEIQVNEVMALLQSDDKLVMSEMRAWR